MRADFWYKLFHAPTVIFEYDKRERDVYEHTRDALKATLEDRNFFIEWDDEKLEIRVWRRNKEKKK